MTLHHVPPVRRRIRNGAARLAALGSLALLAVCAVVLSTRNPVLVAQETTPVFTKDVAPILYKNCTGCHRQGGLGPFSLLEYDSAKANVDDIKDAVRSGFMPPWHAEGPHGTFLNDRRLSAIEKSTILRWIDGGAKRGDMKLMPPAPVYASGWEMGAPDAIVKMPEPFVVPAAGTVEYQYFEAPTGFTEDKWVQSLEILPGARDVVHHVLVYAKVPVTAAVAGGTVAPPSVPGAVRALPLFVRKPKYDIRNDSPRKDTLHGPPRQLGSLIGTTAPGTNVLNFPAGTALRVRAGTVLVFQMHYTAHGHETSDQTSVGFRFAAAQPDEEIRAGNFVNGALELPAGEKDIMVPSELEPTQPVRIWALFPHTHLRGTRWKYTLDTPDGASRVVLDVPRYDFNWQTYYFFATPLEMPAGSKLKSLAWYDNSPTNKHNPDATQNVKWGDQTWEEMQYTGYLYSVPSRRLRAEPQTPR